LAVLASSAVEPDGVGAVDGDGEYRHSGALGSDRHHSTPEPSPICGFEGLTWCVEATLCYGVGLAERQQRKVVCVKICKRTFGQKWN